MEVISALRHLQELLREGSASCAEKIIAELAFIPLVVGDDPPSSALLREIRDSCELIKTEVLYEELRTGTIICMNLLASCCPRQGSEEFSNPRYPGFVHKQ